jgi:hypothetical protein
VAAVEAEVEVYPLDYSSKYTALVVLNFCGGVGWAIEEGVLFE